jgi:hypothetical protein
MRFCFYFARQNMSLLIESHSFQPVRGTHLVDIHFQNIFWQITGKKYRVWVLRIDIVGTLN